MGEILFTPHNDAAEKWNLLDCLVHVDAQGRFEVPSVQYANEGLPINDQEDVGIAERVKVLPSPSVRVECCRYFNRRQPDDSDGICTTSDQGEELWEDWETSFDQEQEQLQVPEEKFIRPNPQKVVVNEPTISSDDGLTDNRKEKLRSMIKLSEGLAEDQKGKFFDVVYKNHQAFAVEPDEIGVFTGEEATINTGDSDPIALPLRRFWFDEREEIDWTIEKLHRMKIIRPSKSPWASAVVPVRKPDESLPICFDYRQLNTVVVDDVHPLPRLDDLIERCGRIGKDQRPCKYFTTLDMKQGYFQIKVREDDGSVQCCADTTFFGIDTISIPNGLQKLISIPIPITKLEEFNFDSDSYT